MKRAMAIVLAGGLGAAGVLVPGVASPHGGDDRGACRGDGVGMRGPGGMHGMMGMMDDDGGMMGSGRGQGTAMGGGLGPVWRLELTDVQRTQMTRISDALRRTHWATMGKVFDARAKLRDLSAQPHPDPKQVGAAFAEVSRLRQEMVEASVRARNEARGLLTAPQRERLDRWRSRSVAPGAGSGDEGTGSAGDEGAGSAGDEGAAGEAGDHEEDD